jgi:hypothetical protein
MKNSTKNIIKEMENKKRQAVVNVTKDDTISFENWWIVVCKRLNLKSWLKEILLADFKGRGLTEKESTAKYEDALKKFGL